MPLSVVINVNGPKIAALMTDDLRCVSSSASETSDQALRCFITAGAPPLHDVQGTLQGTFPFRTCHVAGMNVSGLCQPSVLGNSSACTPGTWPHHAAASPRMPAKVSVQLCAAAWSTAVHGSLCPQGHAASPLLMEWSAHCRAPIGAGAAGTAVPAFTGRGGMRGVCSCVWIPAVLPASPSVCL